MAGLFDKQAEIYLKARPTFPSEWFSMLAALTPRHSLAWDAGTGNGQAAISLAEHYDQVIATDISEEQIKLAIPNPKVRYFHTPSSLSDDEMVSLVGGENSVDLVTVAVAVHYFDLERFYNQVKRVLRKPSGIIAVWTYNIFQVNPEVDPLIQDLYEKTFPYMNPKGMYAFEGYKTLPFPFQDVGVGCEGQPKEFDLLKEMSFQGMLALVRTSSAFNTAKDQGVDLLPENVVKELETAWGGSDTVRTVNFKTYMIAGKI